MYTFKLQAVLDHRQFAEDQVKKELAAIRQQVMAAREQLEALKGKEMNTTAALKKGQAQGLSSDQVVAYHAYLKRLTDRIAAQKTVVLEIKQQEAIKEGELREAMKNRQMLEKLKDQGLDRYHQAMLKKEMKFIDEVAVNRFVRKTIQGNGDSQ